MTWVIRKPLKKFVPLGLGHDEIIDVEFFHGVCKFLISDGLVDCSVDFKGFLKFVEFISEDLKMTGLKSFMWNFKLLFLIKV
jgi:hypothetical protein